MCRHVSARNHKWRLSEFTLTLGICFFFIIILHGILFNLLQKQHRDNRKKGFSVYIATIITLLFQRSFLHCKRCGAANVTPNHSVRGLKIKLKKKKACFCRMSVSIFKNLRFISLTGDQSREAQFELGKRKGGAELNSGQYEQSQVRLNVVRTRSRHQETVCMWRVHTKQTVGVSRQEYKQQRYRARRPDTYQLFLTCYISRILICIYEN